MKLMSYKRAARWMRKRKVRRQRLRRQRHATRHATRHAARLRYNLSSKRPYTARRY